MTQLLLSKHVHLCLRGDHVVLLDVSQGKYLSLEKKIAGALGSRIVDWPLSEPSEPDSTVLESLLDHGLLTRNAELGKSASPTSTIPPARMLMDLQELDPPAISVDHVRRFIIAHTTARVALRWRSLRGIVDRVRRRTLAAGASPTASDIQRTSELVAIFERCRPFAFSKINTCMHYSLALIEFLAGYKVFPQWVFGVKTSPFLAHCWVQQGDLVLNDRIMFIEEFTPIMVV